MSRQSYSVRHFNPSNRPGTCLYCGRTLPKETGGVRHREFFCSIVDAMEFAIIAASHGARYKRKGTNMGSAPAPQEKAS